MNKLKQAIIEKDLNKIQTKYDQSLSKATHQQCPTKDKSDIFNYASIARKSLHISYNKWFHTNHFNGISYKYH